MDIYADVVIVGTGVGGLFAALNIEPHKKVELITKSGRKWCFRAI